MSNMFFKDLEGVLNLSPALIKSDYPLIGKGNSRNVYDLQNGYVVKVTTKRKVLENRTECFIWENASEEEKEFLAPCYMEKTSPQKNYMPLAEKVPFTNATIKTFLHETLGLTKFNQLMNVLYQLSEKHNLYYFDLFLSKNWGKFGDQYKLIDYGMRYDD